jgi:hypothetical protein
MMERELKDSKTARRNGVSDSLIRIELISHFHRNPGLEGTSLELASMIGRDRDRVESQMKKLVQLNILSERQHDGRLYYSYVPPHCVSLFGEREGRRRRLPLKETADSYTTDSA